MQSTPAYICLLLLPTTFIISTVQQAPTIDTICDNEGTCINSSSILHVNTSDSDYDEEEFVKNFLNISTLKPTPRAPDPPVETDLKPNSIELNPAGNACPCDLLPSTCDINCCCDLDCKEYQLSVFSHCYDYNQATKLYDSRYCYRTDFIKKNRTDFILDRLADNLFCISHDNLPPFYTSITTIEVQNRRNFEEVLKAHEEDESTPLSFQWQEEETQELEKFKANAPYVHGDLLRTYDNKSMRTVDVPSTGFTGQCSSRKSLKYLEDFQSVCLQTQLSNSNKFLFSETFTNISLISNSLFMKNVTIRDSECSRNVCIPIDSRFCGNSGVCNGTVSPKGLCDGGVCSNVVRRVTYVIHHNGTSGIQRARVFVEVGNTSRSFHQYFQVKYEWINEFDRKGGVVARSGNPGYLIGKPIIIGTLVTSNITKTNVLNEIVINTTSSVLKIPLGGKDGKCYKNEEEKLIVGFGEDIKSKCSVSLTTNDFSSKSCVKLQEKILERLFGDTLVNVSQIEQYKIHVSKASNTSSNVTHWTQVLLNKIPRNNANTEVFGDETICVGVIKSVRIDVLYSVLPKIDDKDHYKIIGVGITLGEASQAHWDKCSGDDCVERLEAEVVSYVVFHDISNPSMYYYAGGPNLDISLPYDFFYPFLSGSTYSRAGGNRFNGLYYFSFCSILYAMI
ncbi:tectonic-3 [Diachasma alloeum]|uniref:tectonic-3 n=1 Tax=Diachasma alloeum TaxID=454923 RepID=UPI0007381368|nr:tectonic-3 [Diachasma alloeum]